MSGYVPQKYDRVRVTFEAEYMTRRVDSGNYVLAVPAPDHATSLVTIACDVPAWATLEKLPDLEPPPGTVVLDADGEAWQRGRYVKDWWASGSETPLTWDALNRVRGPLRVIYSGGGE